MAGWILPAVTAGVSAISAARNKRTRFDAKAARRINDRYMGIRPEGYLTNADQGLIEATRARGTRAARATGALARAAAGTQARARGLSGASAAALLTDAGQAEARGRESAFLAASDLGGSLYGNNRDFEREKLFKAWGSELGAAAGDAAQSAQQEAGLWNSIIGAAPIVASAWGGVPTAPAGVTPAAVAAPASAAAPASTYNPSAGLPNKQSVPAY